LFGGNNASIEHGCFWPYSGYDGALQALIKTSLAVIDLEGARSLGIVEFDLGLCSIDNNADIEHRPRWDVLLRDKDPRDSNSGFQPVMKLIQEIFDFLAIVVLKQLHA
jgi:hypothetical protein